VNDDAKKKKKTVSKKQEPVAVAPTSGSEAAVSAPPPQGVTMGSGAPADTGTTTFDANAVNLRANGAGDANTFLRNLPNVQYQNQAGTNRGATTSKTIDTKPAEISISGARTYENNFIVNGVSVNNITGTAERTNNSLTDVARNGPTTTNVGASAQTIFVPAEFIGQATVIDSNASAEYGNFLGGVVMYDLTAPPTDRYRASVSVTKESSDYASYILRTIDGRNPNNVAAPEYEKNSEPTNGRITYSRAFPRPRAPISANSFSIPRTRTTFSTGSNTSQYQAVATSTS
jgi:hypothetical protein